MLNKISDWLTWLDTHTASGGDLAILHHYAEQLKIIPKQNVIITVAGTNGKGSVSTFLANLLTNAGYKTGLFTSPHLIHFNERIAIDLQAIDDKTLCQAFTAVAAVLQENKIGWFNVTLLLALWIFQQAKLDVIILEVGLGGRLDATNIIDADISVITSIQLDHMDLLGQTREEIGREKAGIFRAGKPAVIGEAAVPATVLEYAQKLNTPLLIRDRNFFLQCEAESWHWTGAKRQYDALPLPHILLDNAATALMVSALLPQHLQFKQQHLITALQTTLLPGRLQTFERNGVQICFDVAHNPAACEKLHKYLQYRFAANKNSKNEGQTFAVAAFYRDKDIAGCLAALLPDINVWLVASSSGERRCEAAVLQKMLQGFSRDAEVFSDVSAAYTRARELARSGDRIVVFGSFSTVAKALFIDAQ